MKSCISILCASILVMLATGTAVAQDNCPPPKSLDQKLKDIYLPARVEPSEQRGCVSSMDQLSVDPLARLRQLEEQSRRELEQTLADRVPVQTAPTAPSGPQIGLSLSSDKICVNGFVFNKSDDVGAIESMKHLAGVPRPCPRHQIADWVPMSGISHSLMVKAARERICQPWFGKPPAVCDIFR